MRLNRMLAGATAGAALLVLGGGASASAAPSTPATPSGRSATCGAAQLAYVQARVDVAVSKRQLAIRGLTGLLAQRPQVSAAHRSTLTGLFTADAAGLTSTDATGRADTTCKQAVTDGRTVVTSYRVFMLLVP